MLTEYAILMLNTSFELTEFEEPLTLDKSVEAAIIYVD